MTPLLRSQGVRRSPNCDVNKTLSLNFSFSFTLISSLTSCFLNFVSFILLLFFMSKLVKTRLPFLSIVLTRKVKTCLFFLSFKYSFTYIRWKQQLFSNIGFLIIFSYISFYISNEFIPTHFKSKQGFSFCQFYVVNSIFCKSCVPLQGATTKRQVGVGTSVRRRLNDSYLYSKRPKSLRTIRLTMSTVKNIQTTESDSYYKNSK